jgi:hypothetical protein
MPSGNISLSTERWYATVCIWNELPRDLNLSIRLIPLVWSFGKPNRNSISSGSRGATLRFKKKEREEQLCVHQPKPNFTSYIVPRHISELPEMVGLHSLQEQHESFLSALS